MPKLRALRRVNGTKEEGGTLKAGQTFDTTDERAKQFLQAGSAELVSGGNKATKEAAAT